MEQAVEIYNDEARTGTFIVSQGFEREHFKVLRLIEKYEERFLRLESNRRLKSLIRRRIPVKKAGRPVDEIMLNQEQFYFLGIPFGIRMPCMLPVFPLHLPNRVRLTIPPSDRNFPKI